MNPFDTLLLALAGAPSLPGALCRGKHETFSGDDGPDGQRTRQAAQLCSRCPSLDRCREWADEQAPKALDGVVAGRLYQYVAHESQRKHPNGLEIALVYPARRSVIEATG